jgi:hypothetical protein
VVGPNRSGPLTLALLAVVPLTACHSLGVTRHTIDVGDGAQRTRVHVWVQEQGMLAESHWAAAAACVVLTYPLNVVAGVVYGVSAPFDARQDVLYGPAGWLAGTFVPGCTLTGPIKSAGADDVELDPDAYQRFVAAVRGGDRAGAIAAVNDAQWSPLRAAAVIDVALVPPGATSTASGWRAHRAKARAAR